jgi:hypothetical protein
MPAADVAVRVSAEDQFLLWRRRHPEASCRQAWDAAIAAAQEAMYEHARTCPQSNACCGLKSDVDRRLEDLT